MSAEIVVPERFRHGVAAELHRRIEDVRDMIMAMHPVAAGVIADCLRQAHLAAERADVLAVEGLLDRAHRFIAFELTRGIRGPPRNLWR